MKTKAEVDAEVARLDRRIHGLHWMIKATEEEVQTLLQLNATRKKSLRFLGRKRSEALTFELF